MRLSEEQLTAFGVDAQLIHCIDTAFGDDGPERVAVAVSGGGDSMALLHGAIGWAKAACCPLEAVTLDHGLRSEAADEAAMVAGFCADHGTPHTTLHWDGAQAVGNVAAAGRDARYQMIADWAKARGVGGILLGHTQDDIAETFLMRLARKSGVEGLALMDVRFNRHALDWARPFWQQTREGLRDYLRRHDVPWVDDPTNDDDTHDRPKARKVLAALEPLGIDGEVLKSVAANMSGAQAALEFYTQEAQQTLMRYEAGDVVIPRRPRPPVPPEIDRRLRIAAIRYINRQVYPPRSHALAEMDAGLLMKGKHTLAGCVITEDDGQIRYSRELRACEGPLVWANRTMGQIWDGRWLVSEDEAHLENGPLVIRALGDALAQIPDWRELGVPRGTLMTTPAVFEADQLVAAPLAGLKNGFTARIAGNSA